MSIEMKEKILELLICPYCKNSLRIIEKKEYTNSEIIDGILSCSCGNKFLITSGVPEILKNMSKESKKIMDSYDKVWNEFDYKKDYTYNLSPEQRLDLFFHIFDISYEDIQDKTILDAGCGNGQLACNISKHGCEVYAMDISNSVKRAFKECDSSHVHYVKGDLLKFPFKDNSFDFVWSHGVIMASSDPFNAFKNLARSVKKNGMLYVMVYGRNQNIFFSFLRWPLWKFISKTPSFFQKLFSYAFIIPIFVFKTIKKSSFSSNILRDSKRQYYEMFTTPFIFSFNKNELFSWFTDNGFEDIKFFNSDSGFNLSVTGVKK